MYPSTLTQTGAQNFLISAIPTVPNGGNHTRAFAEAARAPEAHAITLNVAKGIAVTGLRIVTDERFCIKVSEHVGPEAGPNKYATMITPVH